MGSWSMRRTPFRKLDARDLVVRAARASSTLMTGEGAVERVVDEVDLPEPTLRDADERVQGQAHREIPQIVLARPPDDESAAALRGAREAAECRPPR